jgi:hypothetical protein
VLTTVAGQVAPTHYATSPEYNAIEFDLVFIHYTEAGFGRIVDLP